MDNDDVFVNGSLNIGALKGKLSALSDDAINISNEVFRIYESVANINYLQKQLAIAEILEKHLHRIKFNSKLLTSVQEDK